MNIRNFKIDIDVDIEGIPICKLEASNEMLGDIQEHLDYHNFENDIHFWHDNLLKLYLKVTHYLWDEQFITRNVWLSFYIEVDNNKLLSVDYNEIIDYNSRIRFPHLYD